jgi:GNAT superfamily N-acetyltransferase
VRCNTDGGHAMTPALRPATPEDLPDILRLVRALAAYERKLDDVTVTEAQLRMLLFGPVPRGHVVLAEVGDGPPVGIAVFYYTMSTFAGRPGLFLEDLFVEPQHRGTGVGLALMRDLAARAMAENCTVVEWRVLNWNEPSIDFYRRLGAEQMLDWQTRQLSGDALVALAEGTSHG